MVSRQAELYSREIKDTWFVPSLEKWFSFSSISKPSMWHYGYPEIKLFLNSSGPFLKVTANSCIRRINKFYSISIVFFVNIQKYFQQSSTRTILSVVYQTPKGHKNDFYSDEIHIKIIKLRRDSGESEKTVFHKIIWYLQNYVRLNRIPFHKI